MTLNRILGPAGKLLRDRLQPNEMVGVKVKIRSRSILWLIVLAWPVLPTLAANVEPDQAPDQDHPLTRAVAPGEFGVKSIDEQKVSPSIRERARAKVRLMKEHKVLPVSDHDLPDFDAEEAYYRAKTTEHADRPAESSITFVPSNIDATSLRGNPMVGAIPHGLQNSNKIWSGLSRIFIHPRLGHVNLSETDLKTAGGGVVFTKEMINADVNGAPAVILSMQGSEKKSVTKLSWFSDGVLYVLRTRGVDDRSRDELLEIARGIRK